MCLQERLGRTQTGWEESRKKVGDLIGWIDLATSSKQTLVDKQVHPLFTCLMHIAGVYSLSLPDPISLVVF